MDKTVDSRINTYEHISVFQQYMTMMIEKLLERMITHDRTKLSSPELESYNEAVPKFTSVPYGSDEYEETLKQMYMALQHH